MAGTPTTNYNIPTYADTDAPDLSGAYNDAMGIIDTQLKANADATAAKQDKLTAGTGIEIQGNEISATATGGKEYTAGAGIEISGGAIINKQASNINDTNIADVEENGITAAYRGGVPAIVTDPDTVDRVIAVNDSGHSYPGGSVPSVAVLKSYVESKMAAAGAAYTGTAPIAVDNGSHTIGFTASWVDHDNTSGTRDGATSLGFYRLNAGAPVNFEAATTSKYPASGATTYPTVIAVRQYVESMTPAATTSVKGLVQLTDQPSSSNSTLAVTGKGVTTLFTDRGTQSNTPVTVDLLKNLYYDTITGIVYCKPSE